MDPVDRIEQRPRLRDEPVLEDATVMVRGGRDTLDKLERHALRTARAWSLDGVPLVGVSMFAALDLTVTALLERRFATFRVVHVTTAGRLRQVGFEPLPTGLRPHFTIRLPSPLEVQDLHRLLVALGPARENAGYGSPQMWREEL